MTPSSFRKSVGSFFLFPFLVLNFSCAAAFQSFEAPRLSQLASNLLISKVKITSTTASIPRQQRLTHAARRRRNDFDEYDDDDDDDYYDDDEDDVYFQRRSGRKRRVPIDDLGGGFNADSGLNLPSSIGRRDGWRLPDSVSKSLLAGVFILGVGLGVTVDSQVNTSPHDLASRDAIDQAAPNPTLCAKLGASAMAFDQRVFVSFNPFNVYVAQADVKPACVLRDSNVVPVLRSRGLISDDEVRACKNNMNTWAYVGDLDSIPQLSCVYRSQDAQNEFLSPNPKLGIGEDYLDDDRERLKQLKSTGKLVKGTMTDSQKELLQKELLRKQANGMPVVNDL